MSARDYPESFTVRLPSGALARIEREAKRRGMDSARLARQALLRELPARGAQPSDFNRALHAAQNGPVRELAKALAERVCQSPSRQEAESAIRGAREKLIEAGADAQAAEQVSRSLSKMAAKKARGQS